MQSSSSTSTCRIIAWFVVAVSFVSLCTPSESELSSSASPVALETFPETETQEIDDEFQSGDDNNLTTFQIQIQQGPGSGSLLDETLTSEESEQAIAPLIHDPDETDNDDHLIEGEKENASSHEEKSAETIYESLSPVTAATESGSGYSKILAFGLTHVRLHSSQSTVGGGQIPTISLNASTDIIEYIQPQTQVRVVDIPLLTGSTQNVTYDANIIATFITHYSESPPPDLILAFISFEDSNNHNQTEDEQRNLANVLLQRLSILKDVFAHTEKFAFHLVHVVTRSTSDEHNSTAAACTLSRSIFEECFLTEIHQSVIVLNLKLESNGTKLHFSYCNDSLNSTNIISNIPLQLQQLLQSILTSEPNSTFINQRSTTSTDKDNNYELVEHILKVWAADVSLRSQPPTEVNSILQASNNAKLNPLLRRKYPGSLQLLQWLLLTKNITQRSQIPSTGRDISHLLFNVTDMNPAMLTLLQITFPIVVPEIHFDPLIGQGYDPTTDTPLESPFIFDEMEFCSLGFMLPKSMKLVQKTGNVELNHIKFHTNIKSLIASRMKELNLTIRLNETNFRGEFRPGDIMLSLLKSSGMTRARISSTREIHRFQLTLSREDVKFKPEFLDQISTMPSFNVHSRDSVQEWKTLLDEYGAYVVTSAFGGGYLEAHVEVKNQDFRLFRSGNVTAVRRVFESVLSNPVQYTNSNFSNPNVTVLELSVNGGDSKFEDINLLKMNRTTQANILEAWKNSISFDPIMLHTKLRLIPLSEFIREVNASAANELMKATKVYLEGNLKYIPMSVSQSSIVVVAAQVIQTSSPPPSRAPMSTGQFKRAENSVLHLPRTSTTRATNTSRALVQVQAHVLPDSTIHQNNILSMPMMPTREDFEQNNKLLECLQAFIENLDIEIQRSPEDSTLVQLANDIEQLYNQIANTGKAKLREKLLIEVICLNFSKTQSLPLDQLKNLVLFPEDLTPATSDVESSGSPTQATAEAEGMEDGFIQHHHTAQHRSTDLVNRMKNIALQGSVWNLDDMPKSQRQITDYQFIGFGYDLLWDQVTSYSPFLLTENSFNKINMRSFPKAEIIFQYFSSKSEYVTERYHSLVPNTFHQLLPSEFKGRVQPGHTYADLDYVSIVLEYRKVLIRLPIEEPQHLRVSEEFKNDVRRLPISFDITNCTCANAWKRFLNRYGTHTITEAFIGGAMEFRGRGPIKESLLQLQGRPSDEIKSTLLKTVFPTCMLPNCTFRVIGGNSSIFNSSSSSSGFTNHQFDSWVESIPDNMVVLPTRIKLKTLHHIFLNPPFNNPITSVGSQFLMALNAYYSDELKACRGSIQCGPFLSYNETSNQCICRDGQIWSQDTTRTCETLAGQNCSTMVWDNCVENAICTASESSFQQFQLSDRISVCKCHQGYDMTNSGKCSIKYAGGGGTLHPQPPPLQSVTSITTMTCTAEEQCQNSESNYGQINVTTGQRQHPSS